MTSSKTAAPSPTNKSPLMPVAQALAHVLDGAIALQPEQVPLLHAAGRTLVAAEALAVPPGSRVHIHGNTSAGKSSLVRAIAALWPWGRGRIELPAAARLMVVPQKPYLPTGTLRQALLYPDPVAQAGETEVLRALADTGLSHLACRLDQIELETSWRPSATFAVDIDAEHNVGRLPAGRFAETVASGRLRFSPSPELQFNTLIQYDTDSKSVGTNTRLRWAISPTAEVFVIYNHNIRDRLNRWEFESNRLLTKVQVAFRR